mgnify:CR=1 FL=1|jgi:hypothetical protein|tara:strand:- start:1367 stop:1804 length:438 start_codon:yes stop_codon:yes gene_type:complete
MKSFFEFTHKINNSKLFAGLVMIMLNIGSKYITIKLSKSQEQYLRNSIARQLLIFSIVWMGTRDVILSFFLTATFIVLTDHLFNEESQYCVIPASMKNYAHILDENNDNYVSKEELEKAMKLVEKAQKQTRKQSQFRMVEGFAGF